MSTLLILDTSSFIHRAYHGYRHINPIKNKYGKPIWVSYGVLMKFRDLIRHYKPQFVVSCEDTRDNAYLRRKIYEGYKDNRKGSANDELSVQFEDVRDAIRSMGVKQLSMNGYEADDVIAAVVKKFKKPGLRIIIVTGDKDMSQLVDSINDVEVHLNNGKGSGKLKYEELITESDVVDKYGVHPHQIPDLFGLIGDSSDGIPGVSGMHENIAKILLDNHHFSNLEELYDNLDGLREDIPGMSISKLRIILEHGKDVAFMSKLLASPLPLELPEMTIGSFIVNPDPIPLAEFTHKHGIEFMNKDLGFVAYLSEMQKYMSLVRLLTACNNDYYRTGKSKISDLEYDRLLEELKEMEHVFGYKYPYSPSITVGSDKSNFGNSIKHNIPMLSLDNSYEPATVLKWMKGIQDQYTFPIEFSWEWKWDGISLSLHYENGQLVRAVTRGDGAYGGDVTQNAKMLKNVPHRLKDNTFTDEVRGEVIISKSDFNEINEIRKKQGLDSFANPRNASSVISSGKNPQDIADRRMQFIAYKIMSSEESHNDDSKRLEQLGFKNSGVLAITTTDAQSVNNSIYTYDKYRTNFDYPTDGLVISVINKQVRLDLGETTKFPRWAKAYKFNPEGGVTALIDVRWQVGRKGTITPVAIIEPVEVSGSVISRASLHNVDRLLEKNLKYGDIVLVEKAAEIIPQVIKVVSTSPDNIAVAIPETCPCCGTKLERDGVALRCMNDSCADKVKAYLEYIASKDILDLKEFGPSVIETLYNRGVRDIVGLFDLKSYDGLEFLEGYGDTSKAKLLTSIEDIRKNGLDLYRLIASLGIPLVGKTIGKKLAALNSIETFLQNVVFGTQIGDKAKNNIMNFLSNPDNIIRIRKLLEHVPMKNTMNISKTSKLLGKSFCISGKLPTNKDKIELKVRENGGTMLSGVSANLSYLICEETQNSKPQKAIKIGIPVISYTEFLNMIK